MAIGHSSIGLGGGGVGGPVVGRRVVDVGAGPGSTSTGVGRAGHSPALPAEPGDRTPAVPRRRAPRPRDVLGGVWTPAAGAAGAFGASRRRRGRVVPGPALRRGGGGLAVIAAQLAATAAAGAARAGELVGVAA